MTEPVTIDVREMPPRERHPRIFGEFDALPAGGAIMLINDHDPRPLFYQLQAERAGQAGWTPVEQGPERWVIRIEKLAASIEPLVVDVREDIRSGREPFGKIMAAVESLAPGQPLEIINVFEPAPLYGVLGDRGFSHETSRTEDGDWRIRFTPGV